MNRITLSDDQLEVVQGETQTIEVRDRRGNLVGFMSRPPSESEIAEAKRRLESVGPWFTTGQVLNHLKSLEQG